MKQLRTEELGDTWLKRRKPTTGLVPNDDDELTQTYINTYIFVYTYLILHVYFHFNFPFRSLIWSGRI